jgi:hypothetical protein
MAQLSGTFNRPSFFVPAAAALIVAGAVALGAVAWSLAGGTGTSVSPTGGGTAAPVTRTDRAAIVGGIQSEYLAGVASGWYVTAPRTDRASIVGRLDSEYLRGIAAGWYAPVARTDRDAILGGIQSEYLRGIAAGWYVTAPAFDPNQLQSEYLREIARDW